MPQKMGYAGRPGQPRVGRHTSKHPAVTAPLGDQSYRMEPPLKPMRNPRQSDMPGTSGQNLYNTDPLGTRRP